MKIPKTRNRPPSPEGFDIAPYEFSVTVDAAALPLFDQWLAFEPDSTRVVLGLVER